MTNFFKNLVTISALSILTTTYLNAQLIEIPFESKTKTSSLIIEGAVTRSEPFIATDGIVYTANEIEISRILKGTDFPDNKVTVITMGGQVGSLLVTWSHFLTLKKGETGVFFLQPTNRPNIEGKGFPNVLMEVYSSSQGFLRYFTDKGKTITIDPFNRYSNIQLQVFDKIAQLTGEVAKTTQQPAIMNLAGEGNCVIYSFEPIKEFQNFKIGADIKVRMETGSYELYQSVVVLEYDTTFFGANIVQNGALELYDGDISSSSSYSLSATDLAPNKLEVKLETVSGFTSLYTIGEQKSFLARVYITIVDPLGNFGVSFDYDAMGQGNLFYDDALQQATRFECVDIDNQVFPFVCPDVVSFTTSTGTDTVAAGVGDVVTIIGSDFGTPSGSIPPAGSSVLFRRVRQIGSPSHEWMLPIQGDYTTWTDTLIRVRVPSFGLEELGGDFSFVHAGTGSVGVIRDGCIDSTVAKLYVKFTAVNEGYLDGSGIPTATPRKLTSRNGEGGYDLYFTTSYDTLNGGTAVPAFKRALTTWRCATGVNFRIKDFADIPAAYLANACKIDYGNMPAGVPSSLIAYTDIDQFDFCAATSTVVWFAYLKKFDLIFNDDYTWYTGESDTVPLNWVDTVDMETTALHELGHAHLLAHSNNPENQMYHLANEYRRDLREDDLCGGKHIVQISAVDTIPSCQPAMQKVPFSECDISTSVIAINGRNLEIIFYPNPATEIIQVEISGEELKEELKYGIFNNLGQIQARGKLTNIFGKNSIGIHSLPKGGLYFVIYEGGFPAGTFKFIKL